MAPISLSIKIVVAEQKGYFGQIVSNLIVSSSVFSLITIFANLLSWEYSQEYRTSSARSHKPCVLQRPLSSNGYIKIRRLHYLVLSNGVMYSQWKVWKHFVDLKAGGLGLNSHIKALVNYSLVSGFICWTVHSDRVLYRVQMRLIDGQTLTQLLNRRKIIWQLRRDLKMKWYKKCWKYLNVVSPT